MKKFISLLVLVMFLVSSVNASVFASTQSTPDSLNEVSMYLKNTYSLTSDGIIGIPVKLHTYYDENKNYVGGYKGNNIILYVINTNTERIGNDSDNEIVKRFIDRDCIVVVLDYMNNPLATGQALDRSAHKLRNDVANGNYVNNVVSVPHNCYIVPSGYDIDFEVKYFSYDEYGSAGDMEYIVEVWKNDFTSVRRNDIITIDGKKTTVWDYTNSFTDENPMTIYDCVNPDGAPLDFNLYMDIIYPTSVTEKVPVMVLRSSGNNRPYNFIYDDRFTFNGFLFGGYIGIIADYTFVPMYSDDNSYGDFQGTGFTNAVSGFNQSYSMGIFDDMKADTALMRKIRLLGDPTDDNREYEIDVDAIGIFGNSKGGHMTRLANPNPEQVEDFRYHEGHLGETRYEAINDPAYASLGYVDPYYNDDVNNPGNTIIREPKEQPYQTYMDGSKIPSIANFVYANCGLGGEKIVEGSSPLFNSGTMQAYGSYYNHYLYVMNYAKSADVPCVNLVCENLGHKIGYGIDRDYGVDVYEAFLDTSDYWLKGEGAKCLYINVSDNYEMDVDNKITFQFTGVISEQEIKKISIVNSQTSKKVIGVWTPSYGGMTWEFVPHNIEYGYSYEITVPDTIVCENGSNLQKTVEKTFTTKIGQQVKAKFISNGEISDTNAAYILFPDKDFLNSSNTNLRLSVTNDASNTLEVYAVTNIDKSQLENSVAGDKLGEIRLIGKGDYNFDVTDYVNSVVGDVAFKIVCKNKGENVTLKTYSASDDDKTMLYLGSGVLHLDKTISNDDIEGGDGAYLKVDYAIRESDYIDLNNDLSCNSIVADNQMIWNLSGFKGSRLTADDYGRRFKFSYDVYDTTERILYATMTGGANSDKMQIDEDGYRHAFNTVKNEWKNYSMEYVVDDARDWEIFDKRILTISGEIKGTATIPEKAAVAPSRFATGSGEKDAPNYAGERGLNDTYTTYANLEAAKSAGIVNVKKSQPIYFDNFKFEEVFTDVTISVNDSLSGSAPSLIMTSYDEQTNSSTKGTYIENADNADVDYSTDNVVKVNSGSLGFDKESIKSYAKFSLEDYYGGVANVRVNCTSGDGALIKVYAIADKDDGQSWTANNITAENAPANDLISHSIDVSKTYNKAPIKTFTATTGKGYNLDITSFAREMYRNGATDITLVFVGDTENKNTTLSIADVIGLKKHLARDFTNFTFNWVWNNNNGNAYSNITAQGTDNPDIAFYVSEESEDNYALCVRPYNQHNTVSFIGTLNSSRRNEFTKDDLGKTFKVKFRAKADEISSLTCGFVSEAKVTRDGVDCKETIHQPMVCNFDEINKWYEFSYDITVDEHMLGDGTLGTSINLLTFRTTGVPTNRRKYDADSKADASWRMTYYIDDVVIEEAQSSQSLDATIGVINNEISNVNYNNCESGTTLTPYNSNANEAIGRNNALYFFEGADYSNCERVRFSVNVHESQGDKITLYAKAVDNFKSDITWNSSMNFTSSDNISTGSIQGNEISVDITEFAKANSNKKIIVMLETALPDESITLDKNASILYGSKITEPESDIEGIILDVDSIDYNDSSFSIDCVNNTKNTVNAIIFAVTYENDSFTNISKPMDITLPTGKTRINNVDISFVKKGESYKVFVWNDINSIKPVCKAQVFEKQ